MNNEQLYKDFEALNKEASLGGGLNRIEKQHACGRMTAREPRESFPNYRLFWGLVRGALVIPRL